MTDDERREVARRLRKFASDYGSDGVRAMNRADANDRLFKAIGFDYLDRANWVYLGDESPDLTPAYAKRLADLIEPSSKPSVEYEAWYNGLVGWAISRDEAKTVRELIEEIVWTALTVDLGPNGNVDTSTGIDEGDVYTDGLFSEWERDALRLSGGCDRDELLALADEILENADLSRELHSEMLKEKRLDMALTFHEYACELREYAGRIREALGERS